MSAVEHDLIFRKPCAEDAPEIERFRREFEEDGSSMDGTGILFRSSAEEWLAYVDGMETGEVPCLQYGLFRESDGRLLGMLQIRLRLVGYLVEFGGHVGYCVRPSERRKGYAAEMLRRALAIAREKGLSRVLVTCLSRNEASARTIRKCGGVFEKTVFDLRNYQENMDRYWIEMKNG